jgi:hypothetical protein
MQPSVVATRTPSSPRPNKPKTGLIVQERDRHLLRELGNMRVLDGNQAKIVAEFQSTRRVNRRLLALTRSGLLKRFFMGTAAGGRKALYSLSPLGANLVEVPCRGPRRSKDELVPADNFVTHQLGINELYCKLKYESIPVDGTKVVRWKTFYRPIDARLSLIPDGYMEIVNPEKTVPAFLEFDVGRESITIWRAKVHKYIRYVLSGEFARSFEQTAFRVLVVTTSESRLQALRRATAPITKKVFWFSTTDSIQHHGLWSSVWLRSTGDQSLPLL